MPKGTDFNAYFRESMKDPEARRLYREVLARFSLAADEPVAETTDSSWENAGVSPKPASGKASWASWAA